MSRNYNSPRFPSYQKVTAPVRSNEDAFFESPNAVYLSCKDFYLTGESAGDETAKFVETTSVYSGTAGEVLMEFDCVQFPARYFKNKHEKAMRNTVKSILSEADVDYFESRIRFSPSSAYPIKVLLTSTDRKSLLQHLKIKQFGFRETGNVNVRSFEASRSVFISSVPPTMTLENVDAAISRRLKEEGIEESIVVQALRVIKPNQSFRPPYAIAELDNSNNAKNVLKLRYFRIGDDCCTVRAFENLSDGSGERKEDNRVVRLRGVPFIKSPKEFESVKKRMGALYVMIPRKQNGKYGTMVEFGMKSEEEVKKFLNKPIQPKDKHSKWGDVNTKYCAR
jgi:hypothetical protein